MEKMSPYLCDRLTQDRLRFLTSSQGREPTQPRQGGPGGKFLGLMDALMQNTTRMASRATTTGHMAA
jgi:hypothetical protein